MKRLTDRPYSLGVKPWRFVLGFATWVTLVVAALLFVVVRFVSPWIKEGTLRYREGIVPAVSNELIYRVEARELPLLVDRWMEAGKPEGEALKEFMRGMRADLLETNRIIGVQGQMFSTKFALTNPNEILEVESFFITTNKVLIQIDKDGKAKLASEK
jgi:hypothetical protein